LGSNSDRRRGNPATTRLSYVTGILIGLRILAAKGPVFDRLPIEAPQTRSQVKSNGICGGQSGIGTGLFLLLLFPLPILIPQNDSDSLMILSSTVYSLYADSIFK
jgi:hypothetical protein